MNTEDLKLTIEELEALSLEMQTREEWAWLTKLSKIKASLMYAMYNADEQV